MSRQPDGLQSLPTSGTVPLFALVAVETVSACNRACWFCKFGQPRRRKPVVRMDWELIRRIIANLGDLRFDGRLSWYRINEPLLDNRLPDIIRFAKAELRGCAQTVLSNGDLVDEEVCGLLEEAGLDILAVSAYDDETMARMDALRSKGLKITVIDHRKEREAAFVENRGGNIVLETDATRSQVDTDWSNTDCLRPSTALNIHPNGNISLCCGDMYGDVVMGNAGLHRIEGVWYGPLFEYYRRRLRTRGRKGLKLCENCTWCGLGHLVKWPK